MKRLIIIIICLCVLFTAAGCSGNAQYGEYILEEAINPDTNQVSSFPYPISVTIEKNGNVYLMGDLFGVVDEDMQTYHFEQTVPVGDITELIEQDGMWEMQKQSDGTTALLVYPYDEKIIYKLYKLADSE